MTTVATIRSTHPVAFLYQWQKALDHRSIPRITYRSCFTQQLKASNLYQRWIWQQKLFWRQTLPASLPITSLSRPTGRSRKIRQLARSTTNRMLKVCSNSWTWGIQGWESLAWAVMQGSQTHLLAHWRIITFKTKTEWLCHRMVSWAVQRPVIWS